MLRFLITDDDDVTHAFLRHILMSLGDVTHAFSGRAAVEACGIALKGGGPFDCVFMDILMPGMDGWQTMQAISALHDAAGVPAPRFISCTCLSPAEYTSSAKQPAQAADGYLRKPFERRSVLAVLAGLGLAKPPAEDERGEDFW